MITVSTTTNDGSYSKTWRCTDKISLYGLLDAIKSMSLVDKKRPRSIEIYASETELKFLMTAVREHENKLSGLGDGCIYCNKELGLDTYRNVCSNCDKVYV